MMLNYTIKLQYSELCYTRLKADSQNNDMEFITQMQSLILMDNLSKPEKPEYQVEQGQNSQWMEVG